MWRSVILLAVIFLAAVGAAQDLLSVQNPRGQVYPASEAQKLYSSTCHVLEQQFGHAVRPQVVLILGAEKNSADPNTGEIKLKKWDRGLFTQGMVLLALIDTQQIYAFTKKAMDLSSSTVSVADLQR